MSRTPKKPPQQWYGNYRVDSDSMGFEGKDGYAPVIYGFAWVQEPICDPKSKQTSYLVRIEPLVGEACTIRVEAKDLNSSSRIATILGNNGILVQLPSKVQHLLASTAAHGKFTQKTPRVLIEHPGWFAGGNGFYTGNVSILAPSVVARTYRFEPVISSPFAIQGNLDDWWENIGQHIASNPLVLGATCLGMASPFLQQAEQGSRMICFWGPKGCGKTLAIQCAATVFGNGIDPAAGTYAADLPYVTKFSTTTNGIEPLLERYSPMFIPLDELTEQQGTFMGELAYKISSGEGKHRMTSHLKPAKSHRWHLVLLTTSEKPLADLLAAGGKKVYGGMLDRAIDIEIGMHGVFNDFGDFGSFKALTRHLKAACGQYYGAAGHALLEYAVNNPDAVAQRLAELKDIEERLLPENCGDGERRVVKCFSLAEAIGKLAIDAGVLRCDEQQVLDAMQKITDLWWYSRGGALRTVANFLIENQNRIEVRTPADPVRNAIYALDDLFIIPKFIFDHEFGEDANRMVSELAALDALIRDTKNSNRTKIRYCNNRMWAYVIPMKKLEPYLDHALEAQPGTKKIAGDNIDEMFE